MRCHGSLEQLTACMFSRCYAPEQRDVIVAVRRDAHHERVASGVAQGDLAGAPHGRYWWGWTGIRAPTTDM